MTVIRTALRQIAMTADGLGTAGLVDRVGPYADPAEHLTDLLARLDWLLRRALTRRGSREATDVLSFAVITDEEIDRLLRRDEASATPGPDPAEIVHIDRILDDLDRTIAHRVERALVAGCRLPVIDLAHRFALSPLEVDVVITCLAAELDRRYERIYGYLHDDMSRKLPSAGLALALVSGWGVPQLQARALLGPLAPLRHFRILEMVEDGASSPWLAKPLRIDERILAFLLGDGAVDARIADYVGVLDGQTGGIPMTQEGRDELGRLVEQMSHWLSARASRQKPIVYLHGPRNAGIEGVVAQVARQLGLPVLAVDMEPLSDARRDLEETLFLLFREGLLSQAALLIRDADRALDRDPGGGRYHALLRHAAEMGSVLFLAGEGPWRWAPPPAPLVLRSMAFRPTGYIEQLEAWRGLLGVDIAESDLHWLVSRRPLSAGGIVDAWRMARNLAGLRGADEPVTIGDLEEACRAEARPPASGLTRQIEPKHDWEDIVLPAPAMEQLRAICSQAKHVATVYGGWGFERKLSLGKGLSALFSGPPGTGKTMAAEVIAADLDLMLLKIDLSQVVSKYIGETEKNLRQLFDQAAAAHAILFFDEADALLGKRSAVSDAHDRYANTEVAYLLQKMEEYEGIAILATNLRQNMDEAFTRRIRFIVDFPFPEEDDRLRIWQHIWPREVPLASDVDLGWLARQFRLSGSNIRNVALAAAFLAAEEAQAVEMRHLLQATKRELQKMGRLVNEEEYRFHV
jgi:hypothetical protein